MRKRNPSVNKTHRVAFLKTLVLVVAGLGSHSGRLRGTFDVSLDDRMAKVARVRTCGPSSLLLTRTELPPLVAGQVRLMLASALLSFESSSLRRARRAVKMRARPPAQRRRTRRTRSQIVAREPPETTSEERFDPITVGYSKNVRVRPSSSRSLLAGEWKNGLIVEWAAASGRLTG